MFWGSALAPLGKSLVCTRLGIDREVVADNPVVKAETYYGDVIPAEPVSQNTNSKFFQFLNSQRRLSDLTQADCVLVCA